MSPIMTLRAPILSSPQLGSFLEAFEANPFTGEMTLAVLDPSQATDSFRLKPIDRVSTAALIAMCGPLCDAAHSLVSRRPGAAIDGLTRQWNLNWTEDNNAVFTYCGEQARYWNQLSFGLDTIAIRRIAPESSVIMSGMALSDSDGIGLNYFINAKGMGVQSLKRFLGFGDTEKIESVRESLFKQWQINTAKLIADPQAHPDIYRHRQELMRTIAPEQEEYWMDEISLFGGAAVQGRLRSMEAYVNWQTGEPNEMVSIQDYMLEDGDNAPSARGPLPDELSELWKLVAALNRLGEDGDSRTKYFDRLRTIYYR